MNRLAVETPFRPVSRALQFSTSARPYSAPARKSFDDAGAGLSEAEVSELVVRLMDVRSEAEFDHLLGAILTHAAMRAGGSLPAVVGSARRLAQERCAARPQSAGGGASTGTRT